MLHHHVEFHVADNRRVVRHHIVLVVEVNIKVQGELTEVGQFHALRIDLARAEVEDEVLVMMLRACTLQVHGHHRRQRTAVHGHRPDLRLHLHALGVGDDGVDGMITEIIGLVQFGHQRPVARSQRRRLADEHVTVIDLYRRLRRCHTRDGQQTAGCRLRHRNGQRLCCDGH